VQQGVGSTGPGTTLVQDFDFGGPQVVPWNVPVAFSPVFVVPGFANFGVQLELEDPVTGTNFDFSFHDGQVLLSTLNLPDLSNPAFSPFRVSLGADVELSSGKGQERSITLTTTPPSVFFDFFTPPTVTQPLEFSFFTVTELNDINVQYTPAGMGIFGGTGLEFFELSTEAGFSGPPPAGIDEAFWITWVPMGTSDFDLPPQVPGKPLFAPFQTVHCYFSQWRIKGFVFDYDSFFDQTLVANINSLEAGITEGSESYHELSFFLKP
jgi:hypothetical protein